MSKQSSKEGSSKRDLDTPASPTDSDGGGYGNDTLSRQSNFSSYADYTSRDMSEEIEDDEPTLSERVITSHRDDDVSVHVSTICSVIQFFYCFY
jgi:hypothetical protein